VEKTTCDSVLTDGNDQNNDYSDIYVNVFASCTTCEAVPVQMSEQLFASRDSLQRQLPVYAGATLVFLALTAWQQYKSQRAGTTAATNGEETEFALWNDNDDGDTDRTSQPELS